MKCTEQITQALSIISIYTNGRMTDCTRNQEEEGTHSTLPPGTPESTGICTMKKYGVEA